MYGQSTSQYITSPNLNVQLKGGSLVSTTSNAVTVYNTEKNDVPASLTVTGSQLDGQRTGLKIISPNSAVTNSFVNHGLTSTSDKTTGFRHRRRGCRHRGQRRKVRPLLFHAGRRHRCRHIRAKCSSSPTTA